MYSEFEKIAMAKSVLEKIAQGTNPANGEVIAGESFLNDPKLVRCFYFISEVLDRVLTGLYKVKASEFFITKEQKNRVKLPEGKIGVSTFSNCINRVIDLSLSKKLTGVELNRRLKQMGILGELKIDETKSRTVTNDKSKEFGFEMEHRIFKGLEYEMVVMNDQGKKYLLENLESIMTTEEY